MTKQSKYKVKQCVKCGSFAINHHCHGRDGSLDDHCDVCYWRSKANGFPDQKDDRPIVKGFADNAD